jgi:C4-dicarboxylate-binding protein DctP
MEARCGGKVEVQAYPDSQLGSEREVSEGVALGTVEMSTIGMGTFATFYEKLQFVNTPFLLSSREQSWKFYDSEFMAKLNEDVRAAIGVRILGYGENGMRGLSNNVRAIKVPADVAGLKIRVQENPLHVAMIRELGASPTPITFAELYTALQQKTVDGQDNGIPLTVNNRLYEVQPYYTTLAHCYDQLAFIANDEWFSGLDPVLQKIIQEEVDNWKADIRKLAADFDISGIETMRKAGVTVVELTPEERKPFQDKMGPVYDLARGIVGADFFNSVLDAIKATQ